MEPQTTSKTWVIVLGILVVAALGIWLATMPPRETTPNPDETTNGSTGGSSSQNPNVNATQLCYIWNTEGGDNAQLSMDIRGTAVIGEFLWRPAEKDQKTGIFEGTVGAADKNGKRTVTALWKSSGEGMTNTEELRIIYDNKTAAAGFGEMVRGADGIWHYADPANIAYVPTLQQTDCGDEAMD